MSILKKLWADKEIVEAWRWLRDTYGGMPMPFNYDEYSSVDDYKEKLKAFVKKEKEKQKL